MKRKNQVWRFKIDKTEWRLIEPAPPHEGAIYERWKAICVGPALSTHHEPGQHLTVAFASDDWELVITVNLNKSAEQVYARLRRQDP